MIFCYLLRRSHPKERFTIFSEAAAERVSTQCCTARCCERLGWVFVFHCKRGFHTVFGDPLDLEVPSQSQEKVSPNVFSHWSQGFPGWNDQHFVERTHFQVQKMNLWSGKEWAWLGSEMFSALFNPFHRKHHNKYRTCGNETWVMEKPSIRNRWN